MVVERQERNIDGDRHPFSHRIFWKELVVCLLTTQQRAGPNSAVSRFAGQERFLLSYEECKQQRDLEAFARSTLADFGGIRRNITIGGLRHLSVLTRCCDFFEFRRPMTKDSVGGCR